jgi:hypothetical protein
MRTRHTFFLILMAVLSIMLCARNVSADDIKERMKARLPVIAELKAQGLVGENNRGYLEFRTGQKSKADIVDAENKDRLEVYKAIAARQNATPEFVGQARAAQIAGKEPAGYWIQDSGGAWKKK